MEAVLGTQVPATAGSATIWGAVTAHSLLLLRREAAADGASPGPGKQGCKSKEPNKGVRAAGQFRTLHITTTMYRKQANFALCTSPPPCTNSRPAKPTSSPTSTSFTVLFNTSIHPPSPLGTSKTRATKPPPSHRGQCCKGLV